MDRHPDEVLTGKLLALALLLVALVAGISVAVPALDQPDRPPTRAPMVVEGDAPVTPSEPGGARDGQGAGAERDDRREADDRDDRDDEVRGERDDDVSDSGENPQVIRPRTGGGEVPDDDDDTDDDDRDDDDDDDSDDSDDSDDPDDDSDDDDDDDDDDGDGDD